MEMKQLSKLQLERLFKVLKNNGKLDYGYYQIGAALPKELVLQAAELFCGKRNKIEFYGFVKAVLVERYRKGSKLKDVLLFDQLMVYLTKGSIFRGKAMEQVLASLQNNKLFDKKELEFYTLICEVANEKLSDGYDLSRYIKTGELKGDYRNISGDFMDGNVVYIHNGIETEYYKRLCQAFDFKETEYQNKLRYIPNRDKQSRSRLAA